VKIDWDLAPIAHRGLHDASNGIVENTHDAVVAAMDGGFGIEVDLQVASDDVAMVFHDFSLDRLVEDRGPVRARTSDELRKARHQIGGASVMTLAELLETVAGKSPLYVELKSDFSGDMTLATVTAPVVNGYNGPLALMSFDPWMMKRMRTLCPRIPCGIVSGTFETPGWDPHVRARLMRFALRHMLTATFARPAFVNYDISAISALAPQFARKLGLPLLTWTVRTPEQRKAAEQWADAMVFEGFVPASNV